MEHGIPLSRRAPLVHIARISREEWRPLVAVVRVRYYISKAQFDGPEREKVTTQRIFSTAAQCISRYEYLKRPRSSASRGPPVPCHRILRDWHDRRDWIREHRLKLAQAGPTWRVVWTSVSATCRSRNARATRPCSYAHPKSY